MQSVVLAFAGKQTYTASAAFTPAATATDIVTIAGAAGKVIRVLSVKLSTTNTAAGSQLVLLIKRSALDTTGTFVAGTAVPLDTGFAAAAATVGHYTANPGGLGAAVGTINTLKLPSPVLVGGSFAGVTQDPGFELLPSLSAGGSQFLTPVTLRAAAENLAVNLNGVVLISGQVHAYTIVWTEE
jgi:hypothetical protein